MMNIHSEMFLSTALDKVLTMVELQIDVENLHFDNFTWI